MQFIENGLKYAFSSVICRVMMSLNNKKEIQEIAQNLDQYLDKKLNPKGSENIQRSVIMNFLLPFGRELMHENPEEYVVMLRQEASHVEASLTGKE